MPMIELPFATWRAIIGALREKGLPYMLDHAEILEWDLDQHAPDESVVSLSVSDDAYLRSVNWARVELGIPLPAERG